MENGEGPGHASLVSDLPFPVIISKVHGPVTRRGSVNRTALVARLCASSEMPVVTVVAPAGFGKTTLLRQWADHDPRPFCWLTLDEQDNDPAVLLTYFALALHEIVPLDDAIFRQLHAPRRTTDTLVARLTRAMGDAAEPAVIVVDDAHLLHRPECWDVVRDILGRIPEGWQVAIASRTELPVATPRLRAEGRIAELRPQNLAMDDQEAGCLLAAAEVNLSHPAVAALNRRVEGWPAALYLAALAIAADPGLDPESRQIGGDRFVLDYLRSEVLSHLSMADARFLIRTSVLDRLSGPLCDAVLETAGSADRLERLERSNMLLIPLDHTRTWYRCHQILRDLLSAALQQRETEVVPALRRRAAEWYEANAMPELAIEQAMALADASRVARITVAWGQLFYQRGRAATARRWFAWFDDQDLVGEYPAVAAIGALACMIEGRDGGAERWLLAAKRGCRQDSRHVLHGEIALLEALACHDGVETALRDAERATDLLQPEDPQRDLALLVLGILCLITRQHDRADALLAEAVDVADDRGTGPEQSIARAERALLALRDGRSSDARTFSKQACEVVDAAGLDDYGISAFVYAVAARVRLEHGDVEGAQPVLARAQRLHGFLTHSLPYYTVQTRLELVRCYLAMTDVSGARATLREAEKVVRRRPRLGALIDDLDKLQQRVETLSANPAGASSLTVAELRLLPLMATHHTFREIGEQLFISPNTVKTEAIAVYRKLGVSSRSEAVESARQLGLLGE